MGVFLYQKLNMDYNKNFDLLGIPSQSNTSTISGTRYIIINDGDEIMTKDFFKLHSRIDFDTDDELVETYITAARQSLERWAQISMNIKTVQLNAVCVPPNYKMMYGPVNNIITTGFTNNGDLLVEGGENIEIQYTTLGFLNQAVKIAVARYAAGLYVYRENVVETKIRPTAEADEAKEMLRPFMNLIWF